MAKRLQKETESKTERVGRHHVREEIQRRILTGASKPGERLSQQSLARELGVAQGTVRESLIELQWLGLVDSVDHLGVFVRDLDIARICEAYEVREMLEGLSARLCCGHAARADVAELRKMAGEVLSLAKKGKTEEMASLDRKFHFHIIELSRNSILLRLAETYKVLGMIVRASREPKVIHAEHLRIVDAIEANLTDEAERLARQHVAGASRAIQEQASKGKFIPMWVG